MQNLKAFLEGMGPQAIIERLKLALEGSGMGIWDWDLRDDSVQFDPGWCEQLGLDHRTTEMNLETWRSRVHPEDLEQCFLDIRAHVEGRTATYKNVHRMRHADGRWRYILDRGRISGRDAIGRPIRFTGTHTDITEQEEARRVLAEHDASLKALVANLPAGVAMLDLELRYLTASEQWCEQLRVPLAKLQGRSFDSFAQDLPGRWHAALLRGLQGTASHGDAELISKPGEAERYSRWNVRPWRRVDGSVGGVVLSEEDVTQQVLEGQRSERERNTRLATLALFSGGIAHELNSPLQIMLNEAHLGLELLNDRSIDLEALRESFATIETTARRAASITRALRTLSRDARHDPPVPVPLAGLLGDAMALTRGRAESAGITLTLEDKVGAIDVLGRPSELLHVLLNLLNNAAEAVTGRPGAWIRLEVEAVAGQVVIRCVDSGPGVAAEHLGKLMTPFFTTKPQGTGIGLSLSRALVERDGGYLRHVPEARASTFEVGIPMVGH